jgi:hypothetical protein
MLQQAVYYRAIHCAAQRIIRGTILILEETMKANKLITIKLRK